MLLNIFGASVLYGRCASGARAVRERCASGARAVRGRVWVPKRDFFVFFCVFFEFLMWILGLGDFLYVGFKMCNSLLGSNMLLDRRPGDTFTMLLLEPPNRTR